MLDSAPIIFCDVKAKDKPPACEMIQTAEKEKKKK
jgi:hypothetical protein